jgi:hypothetical protein
MNNNFLEPPSRKGFNSSKEANTIREIFYQHWEKMKDQIVRTRDEIYRWRQISIEHINKHVDQEIQTLNDYYARQRYAFDDSRRANIDTATAYAYHGAKQSDLFDQICHACTTLEFQMAKLETIQSSMEYVKVIIVQDLTKKKHENSIIEQSTNSDDNLHKNGNSSLNSTTVTPDRMK